MERKTGPFLQAAYFCEMVIEDKQGVVSTIRIIDTINHAVRGPSPPEDMEPFDYPMKLVVMLKSGKATGRFDLSIIPEQPSGISEPPARISVHLEGNERGANIISDFRYRFKLEGLYWFHIYLDEEHLTSIPFKVRYSRFDTGTIRN